MSVDININNLSWRGTLGMIGGMKTLPIKGLYTLTYAQHWKNLLIRKRQQRGTSLLIIFNQKTILFYLLHFCSTPYEDHNTFLQS